MCDVLGALHDIFITGCAEMVSLSQSERRISSIPQFGELKMRCIYCFMVPAIGFSCQFMETEKAT